MGLWTRQHAGRGTGGLVHHSDKGVQGGFQWSLQHLELEVRYGMAEGSNYAAHGTAGDAVAGAACAVA